LGFIGPVDAADARIMSQAEAHDFVVLTHDLDFGAILAATQGEQPSVVQIRAGDVSPEAIGLQVVTASRLKEPELSAGALLTVDSNRTRLRVLPLKGKS
jgi:predicted nuclease of predicted toxin-antitoxin system